MQANVKHLCATCPQIGVEHRIEAGIQAGDAPPGSKAVDAYEDQPWFMMVSRFERALLHGACVSLIHFVGAASKVRKSLMLIPCEQITDARPRSRLRPVKRVQRSDS